jgi:hypothetical protein
MSKNQELLAGTAENLTAPAIREDRRRSGAYIKAEELTAT